MTSFIVIGIIILALMGVPLYAIIGLAVTTSGAPIQIL